MKRLIIWDEYKYGQQIIKQQTVKTKKWQYKELNCLAKYMMYHGCDTEDIIDEMYACCQDNLRNLKEDNRDSEFLSIIYKAGKRDIIKDRKIILYKSELDTITALNDINMEKAAFIFLVYSKWLGLKWFGMKDADLKKEAKMTNLNTTKLYDTYYKLNNRGLFKSDVIRVRKTMFRRRSGVAHMRSATFLATSGEIAFEIDNYINVIYKYLNYKNGGYFECKKCGGMVKRRNNRHTFCAECAKYIPIKTKWIECEDCGEEVEVAAKANNRKRCDECILEAKRKSKREWKHRNKQ